MEATSPSTRARLGYRYEDVILTLTEDEARLVLRLGPDDFWTWYAERTTDAARTLGADRKGASP